MLNYLKIYADVLAKMLRPSEQAGALQTAAYFSGEEDLGRPKPRFDADTVLDMAIGWPTPYFMALAERWLSGTSLIGWPGCEAQTLAHAIDHHQLLVTSERVMVVDLSETDLVQVLWQWEREHIASIRRAPRFGQAGRIWVLMADGSAASLMLGLVNPGPAKRVVAAWAAGSR